MNQMTTNECFGRYGITSRVGQLLASYDAAERRMAPDTAEADGLIDAQTAIFEEAASSPTLTMADVAAKLALWVRDNPPDELEASRSDAMLLRMAEELSSLAATP